MSRNSSATHEKNKHSISPILKTDSMPEDEGEVHIKAEAVSSTTTKQQWSVLSVISLDTFNISVRIGKKRFNYAKLDKGEELLLISYEELN